MTRTLLLVRHATSVPPAPGAPSERDRPLTPDGMAQAERLADLVVPHYPARVLSSPYLRAVQTVRPTADRLGLAVERLESLREWASGMDPTPDWQAHYRRCWAEPQYATATGETHDALGRRALAALAQAAERTRAGEVTVVASHGTWISRALLGLGCPVDADWWLSLPMPAVFTVTYGDVPAVTPTGPPAYGTLPA
ncbi:MAG TPA: histidine phosphatase family protein [Frankiaceae bacterium]|nr:histidine phosphatase family protein [Frankiaceae bacterium]